MNIKQAGKALWSVLERVLPPSVGRADLAKIIGYIENAGVPSSVVPDFIGQWLLDTTNSVFYRAYGVSAGNWTALGDDTLSLAELQVLDGATSANATTGKAAILGTSGALTIAGSLTVGTTTISESEIGVLDSAVAGTPAVSKALVVDSAGGVGAFRYTGGNNFFKQAAPAAKTTATTLTAAEILGGLITANQGGAAAANYQMPAASAIETAHAALVPGGVLANDDAFDFTLVNISTVAAEDITLTTNTNITLVGGMVVNSNDAGTSISFGTFRCRRTAANTYSVYRVG
jgi:hypothetical protein